MNVILNPSEIQAYLKRIGMNDIKKPTLEYLIELQRTHVQYLSWQTVDIFAGRPVGISLQESIQLILQGRSGYCFHLNGAFSVLLRSLGYTVDWHRGGVQPHGEQPRVNSFHLGLSVLLPDADPTIERWIVDVGLGGMPFEPLPLRYGTHGSAPFTYQLMPSSVAAGGWRLEYEPNGPSEGVDYAPEAVHDLGSSYRNMNSTVGRPNPLGIMYFCFVSGMRTAVTNYEDVCSEHMISKEFGKRKFRVIPNGVTY